ncbi:hypothetical protein CEXT_705471 [Caerostris extrusa]|uniref:Uncharacterized protein n=1 Tax=Caerostris extrusa TaxID=172846 RepID=A0AAV4Q6Q2_CAEEX|nr:hypothetical protein CEXT_705471 [Caerostris extrusa]
MIPCELIISIKNLMSKSELFPIQPQVDSEFSAHKTRPKPMHVPFFLARRFGPMGLEDIFTALIYGSVNEKYKSLCRKLQSQKTTTSGNS